MEIRTIIDNKLPDKETIKGEKILLLLFLILDFLFSLIPFLSGFYFCKTHKLIFLILFLLFVFFKPEFEIKKNTVNFKLKKLF